MAVKIFCNDCSKPLDDMPRLVIPQMIMVTGTQQGQAQGLHFCNEDGGDAKCLRSWLKKNTNRPMLVTGTPNGPAQ